MIAYIESSPYKVLAFCIIFLLGGLVFLLWARKPQKLFFALVFYIPLSFKTGFGSLSLYFVIFFYLWVLVFTPPRLKTDTLQLFERLLLSLLVIASALSLISSPNFFYYHLGKIRMSHDLLSVITMFSNFAIYHLARIFLKTKRDFLTLFKIMVTSGSIASIAGYLQTINPDKLYFFKYTVISTSERWVNRIAATMPGYEFLAEYTAILILMSMVLFLTTKKYTLRVLSLSALANFVLIMTLTQVRGIYVATALALIYLMLLLFLVGRFGSVIKIAVSSVFMLIVLITSILVIDHVRPETDFMGRFEKLKAVDIKKGELDTRSSVLSTAQQAFDQMSAYELVFGSGHKYLLPEGSLKGSWPHCLYLSYPIRDGMFGLALLLLFLAMAYKRSLYGIIARKKLPEHTLYLIAVGLHLAFMIVLIDEIKIEFIRVDRSQNIIWLLWGTIMAYAVYLRKLVRGSNAAPEKMTPASGFQHRNVYAH